MELNIRLHTSASALHTKIGAEPDAAAHGTSALPEAQVRALVRMAASTPTPVASTSARVASGDAAALARHIASNPAARELAGRTPGAAPSVRVDARITTATAGMAREGAIATARAAIDRATARPVGAEYVPMAAGASAAAPASASAGVAAALGDVMRSESAGSSGDYAFLDDPSLSTREKVMMFIGRQLTGIENDMQRIMRQKAGGSSGAQGNGAGLPTVNGSAATATSATGAGGTGGGGIGDVILGVVGGIAGAAATAFAGPLGGMAVGAVTSAIGSLIHGASGAEAGVGTSAGTPPGSYTGTSAGAGAGTSASGGARSSSGTNATPSEGETNMQLQSLVNRQQQMMTMASNVLSSLHQTAMTPLNNMRG